MTEYIYLEISSTFGCFNKPYSNTGGYKTFPFPTKTSIIGLLGAICGLDLETTLRTFKQTKIGIVPINSVKRGNITYNAHYGQRAKRERSGQRVNIRQQVLFEPKFGILLNIGLIPDDILTILRSNFPDSSADTATEIVKEILMNEWQYYPLYMGKNAHFVTYQYRDDNFTLIDSPDLSYSCRGIIPATLIDDFSIAHPPSDQAGFFASYSSDEDYRLNYQHDYPLQQSANREFTHFMTVAYTDPEADLVIDLNLDTLSDQYELVLDTESNLIVLF